LPITLQADRSKKEVLEREEREEKRREETKEQQLRSGMARSRSLLTIDDESTTKKATATSRVG
jgi:hypothetical protein